MRYFRMSRMFLTNFAKWNSNLHKVYWPLLLIKWRMQRHLWWLSDFKLALWQVNRNLTWWMWWWLQRFRGFQLYNKNRTKQKCLFLHRRNHFDFWTVQWNRESQWVRFSCQSVSSFAHFPNNVKWTNSEFVFVGKPIIRFDECELRFNGKQILLHCENCLRNKVGFLFVALSTEIANKGIILRNSECHCQNELRFFECPFILEHSFVVRWNHKIFVFCNCFLCVGVSHHWNHHQRHIWNLSNVRGTNGICLILMDEHFFYFYV